APPSHGQGLWIAPRGVEVALAFDPDGARLVSGGADGRLRLCDPASGKELWSIDAQAGNLSSAAFSPDGGRIVTTGGGVRVWDARTGKLVCVINGEFSDVAWTPDGRRIVTAWCPWIDARGLGLVQAWDASTGVEAFRMHVPSASRVEKACFAPDGTRLAEV